MATEALEEPATLSLLSAARRLGISRGTAYTLVRENRFPAPVIRVGSQYRIPRRAMARLLGGEATEPSE